MVMFSGRSGPHYTMGDILWNIALIIILGTHETVWLGSRRFHLLKNGDILCLFVVFETRSHVVQTVINSPLQLKMTFNF